MNLHQLRSRNTIVTPHRGFGRRGLLHYALGGTGFLHLLPQGVEIVAGRNHREQQYQNTAQKQKRTRTTERSPVPEDRPAPEDQNGWQCQHQPKKIEQ